MRAVQSRNWLSNTTCRNCGTTAQPIQRQQFLDWQQEQQLLRAHQSSKRSINRSPPAPSAGTAALFKQENAILQQRDQSAPSTGSVVQPFMQKLDPDAYAKSTKSPSNAAARRRQQSAQFKGNNSFGTLIVHPIGAPPVEQGQQRQRTLPPQPVHLEGKRAHSALELTRPLSLRQHLRPYHQDYNDRQWGTISINWLIGFTLIWQ